MIASTLQKFEQSQIKLRTLLVGLSIWSIIAIIAATTAFIALKGAQPALWFSILKPMLVYYYTWGLYSLIIFKLVLTRHNTLSHPLAQLPLHLFSAAIITMLQARITHPDNWQSWMLGERAAGFWLLSIFIYLFILIAALLVKKQRQLRDKEKEVAQARLHSSQLENQLNLAQMDALKMQINPHFLFNALNSIAALIELESNKQAYRTTELLGDLLRSTLSNASESKVPLSEELSFVTDYIELEKVRFGERFQFHQHIEKAAENALVPALILQPLIENSFKHGVAKVGNTVDIRLEITTQQQQLHILLRDNAPVQLKSQDIKEGYGLSNIRRRLELLYGDNARMILNTEDGQGFQSQLILPLTTQ